MRVLARGAARRLDRRARGLGGRTGKRAALGGQEGRVSLRVTEGGERVHVLSVGTLTFGF